MATKEKEKSNLVTLKDVIFVYSSVTHAQKQLNKDKKPPLSDNPLEFHSWEIKILIPETRFKKLKKKYRTKDGKGVVAKNFPNIKEYTPEEVVEIFDLPEPDEDMVLIKFAQGCLTGKKGNRTDSRPIRQIGIKKIKTPDGIVYKDGTGEDIDAKTSLGNGTLGHFQFNPVENDFGLYLYPAAVCITDLVPYVGGGGEVDDDAFGVEDEEFEEEPTSTDDDDTDGMFDDDI